MCKISALLLLSLFLLAGCAKRQRPPADAPAAERMDPETLKLIEAAGDQATLVVVLNPERFRPAAQTLKPLLSGLKAKWKEDALEEKDLFSSAARGAGMSFSRLKLLRAWDRSRPIVAGLYEPQDSDLVLAARALIPVGREGLKKGVPGTRHRILVPARFPGALAEVFSEMAESKKLKRIDAAKGHPALKGGSLFGLPGMNGFVALVPEQDHVRCELLTDDQQTDPDPARRLERYLDLIQNVSREKLPVTPALMSLASRPDLLLVHVRPWMFRELGSLLGVRNIYRALAMVSGDMTMALLAQGMAEVATGSLMMNPAGAEMDDLTVGLDVDAGLRMNFMGSLTESGRAIFQAGLKPALKPPRTIDTVRPILSSWTGLDFSAMLKTAPTPPALGGVKTANDLSMQMMVCGFFCPLHYLLRNPFGLGRTALELAGPRAQNLVPRALGFALLQLQGEQTRAAAAALFPKEADLGFLRAGLTFAPFKTEVLIEPQEDGQLALLGLNTSPREIFNQTQSRFTPGLIGELELDLRTIAKSMAVPTQFPEIFALLKQLKPLRVRSMFGGRSVQGEMLVSVENQKPLGFEDLQDTSGMSWDSPGAKEAYTPGRRCLEQLTRDMIEAFRALAAVSPDFKTVILQRAFEESKPSLDCAFEQPDTRDTAQRIKYAQNIYLAGQFAQHFMPERQLELLDQTCKQGSKQACELAKEARAVPGVRLARVTADCLQAKAHGELSIHLRPGNEPPAGGFERHGNYQIAVDSEVSYQRLMDLVSRLIEGGHGRADLLVRTEKDQLRRIPVNLPAPKGQLQAWPVGTIRIGVAKDGTSFIGQGSGKFESLKELKDSTSHLEALATKAGGTPAVDLRAEPEATMEKVLPLLAAAACLSDPESPVELTLSPATAKASEAVSKTYVLGVIGKGTGSGAGTGLGKPAIRGALGKQVIRRVMKRNQGRVRYCYEKSLQKNPALQGTVTVSFVVAPSGKVIEAKVASSSLKNKECENCLLKSIRALKFPKPKGGIVVISYPFIFKSK